MIKQFLRMDVNLQEHEKFANIDPRGFWIWFGFVAYCARQENDGWLYEEKVKSVEDQSLIESLISRGLLEFAVRDSLGQVTPLPKECVTRLQGKDVTDDVTALEVEVEVIINKVKGGELTFGYVVHDYTDHQTPKRLIEEKREKARNKINAYRETKRAEKFHLLEGKFQMPEGLGRLEWPS